MDKKVFVKNQKELDRMLDDFEGIIYIEFGQPHAPAVVRNHCSSVVACGNSSVEARGNSSVIARGNSSVIAYGNSSVIACDNSSVIAYGNSSVIACDNSSVVARGNSQVIDLLFSDGKICIFGNARIVYMPRNIEAYCDFYNIKNNNKIGIFYKCVHKIDGRYFSDYANGFEYIIGEKAIPDSFTLDARKDCGGGIHVAYLDWALNYGRNWHDVAIIEVEANLEDVVVPVSSLGKVRCKEVRVIREVPLEECGLFGKIISKKRRKNLL